MVDAVLTSEILLVIFFAGRSIWNRLGGWPEAWYRISGREYFRHNHFDADGTPISVIDPTDIIKAQTVEIPGRSLHTFRMFTWKGGRYIVGGPEHTARYNRRPQWYYNQGDMNPVPIRDWKNPKPLDPRFIDAAWNDTSLAKMHEYGEKKTNMIIVLIIGFAVLAIIAGAAAYYAHQGFCAAAPAQCSGGAGGTGFHG